jgi:hypothetical protein
VTVGFYSLEEAKAILKFLMGEPILICGVASGRCMRVRKGKSNGVERDKPSYPRSRRIRKSASKNAKIVSMVASRESSW